jgi:hypothetical protein
MNRKSELVVSFVCLVFVAIACGIYHNSLGYEKARELTKEERDQLYKTNGLTKLFEETQGKTAEQIDKLYKDNGINRSLTLEPKDQPITMYGDSYTSPDYYVSLFSAYYFGVWALICVIRYVKPKWINDWFVLLFICGYLFGVCLLVWIEKYDKASIKYSGNRYFNLRTNEKDLLSKPGWGMPYPVIIFGLLTLFSLFMIFDTLYDNFRGTKNNKLV